jgi:hypothetical protein
LQAAYSTLVFDQQPKRGFDAHRQARMKQKPAEKPHHNRVPQGLKLNPAKKSWKIPNRK